MKVLSPEKFSGRAPTGLSLRQATIGIAPRRAVPVLPGVRGHVEPDIEMRGNRGGPRLGPQEAGTREQAKKARTWAVARKSEPSIVVLIPGNAGGAKGWRFEIMRG